MNLKIKFELEETELNGEIENLIPSSSGGSLPSGGTTGQVLTKNSDADGDAGWSTPEPFIINSEEHNNQLFVNKSYAEIKEAYESGKNVIIIWNSKQYPLSSISDEKVEFFVEESITNSDDFTMYNIHTRTLAIYSESDKRATKDYANLNVYSIKGCDGLFAPKASAVLTTEQTLTTEQQSQVLSNIGGLSKNQGTENAGKVLTVGSDGIVVPDSGSSYTLPIASSTTLGGVKIGSGISVGDDGTISASGGGKNYRKIAEITISEEIGNIVIDKDVNGNPFEITEYLVYGTNVKATGATQIVTSLNSTTFYNWGWTGINNFIDSTTAKNIYMESIWIGRRILRLSSSQWGNSTLSVMYAPNSDQFGNVEKISCINLIACTYPFSQGTITVWGG